MTNRDMLHHILISCGKHPNVTASSIRQALIARGMFEKKQNVEFFLLSQQEWKEKTIISEGIQFRSFNKYYGNNNIIRKIAYLQTILRVRNEIKERNSRQKVDSLIIYPDDIFLNFLIMPLAKRLDIKVFHERTELPYTVIGDSVISKFFYKIYLHKVLPQYDGIFVINDKLEKFIKQYNHNTKKILTVVDFKFFKNINTSPFDFPYIGYCGTISGTKDGVPILIDAYKKISVLYPDLKLVLIGNNSDKQAIKSTLKRVEKLKLQDKVVFTGFIPRKKMAEYLGNAKLLVVSKQNTEQNSGNFPIKIGEYLATGIPVVVTDVGEISRYIKHLETGFLSKPDSSESFAEAMKTALSNYKEAKEIAKHGKQIAEKNFNYKRQAGRVIDFIYSKI